MGPTREIQDQLRELLTDAVTILCKTRLDFCSQLNIEGLIGITLDEHDVFLVKLDELVKNNFQRKEQNIVEDTTEIHEELSDVPTENVKSQRREKDKGALRVARKRSHSDSEKNSESAADLPVECGSNENEPSPSKKPNIELQEYQDENATAETERVIKQEPVDERDCLENAVIEEYQLDSETHKNLNNFIDNLMTSHAMPGSSHSAASDYAQPGPSLATSFDSISASSATHTQSMDSSQMLSPSNITTIAPKDQFQVKQQMLNPSKYLAPFYQMSWKPQKYRKLKPKVANQLFTNSAKTQLMQAESFHLPVTKGLRLSCVWCQFVTEDKLLLAEHMRTIHKQFYQKSYVCDHCGLSFAKLSRLNYHVSDVHSEVCLNCRVCGQKFKGKYSLKQHEKGFHSEHKYICRKMCGKIFRWRSSRQNHERQCLSLQNFS